MKLGHGLGLIQGPEEEDILAHAAEVVAGGKHLHTWNILALVGKE